MMLCEVFVDWEGQGFIRGSMTERQSPCLSKWRSRRPTQNSVSKREDDSILFICYSAMHNMNTGPGCSFCFTKYKQKRHAKPPCSGYAYLEEVQAFRQEASSTVGSSALNAQLLQCRLYV